MSNTEDVINHPSHYTQGDIETIDAMVLMFGPNDVSKHCLMTCFKYLERYEHKGNPEQDLRKAKWYAEKSYMLKWDEESYSTKRSYLRKTFTGCNEYLNDLKYLVETAKNDIRTLAGMCYDSNDKFRVSECLIEHIDQAIEALSEDSQ